MTAAISDFFILMFSACILGGILSSAFALLYKIWNISANQHYFHTKLILVFYITAPLLCLAAFFHQAKGYSVLGLEPDFEHFFTIYLPISYYFYDYYKKLDFLPYAFALWLIGFIIIFFSYHILSRRWFRQLKKLCCINTDYRVERIKERIAKEYAIAGKIQIYRSEFVVSPFLSGLFYPAIFLPQKDFSEEYIEFILRHELIHLRKKDILFKQLLIFIKSFYWFSPLIYLFSKKFYDHCEIACDEMLLKETGKQNRVKYAQCIISFAVDKQFRYIVGFHSQNTVEKRIAAISNIHSASISKKRTVLLFVITLLLFFTAAVLAVTVSNQARAGLGKWIETIYFIDVT